MKKVIIIGLGAIGLTFGVKLKGKCNLKILADKERVERYKKQKPIFNGIEQDFNYILQEDNYNADLIIISTKIKGFNQAVQSIKNFVSSDTRVISLLNGISSEEFIQQTYPKAKVLKSYFIGHSAVREGNCVTQDGIGEIVMEHDEELEKFFSESDICYSVPKNIDYSIWLKYTLNIFSNQTSAIMNMTFGELKRNKNFISFAKKIIFEVKEIAKVKNISGLDNLEEDALKLLNKMCDDGKTSMLQDVLSKRPTEVDIFSGEIVRLGKKYKIPTPYNQVLYDLIKIKEEDNEYSIYSC